MKKNIILIFILVLLFPIMVNAETNYLYDVLKNEAENNGLAREYTGEHHDSFTEEPSHKIYHWYAQNDDEGNQVLEKNNVIFGGFCWQMLRTTDTGGVKLIYNGIVNEGICNNTGINQSIGKSKFNENTYSISSFGYMYNNQISIVERNYGISVYYSHSSGNSIYLASSYTYDQSTNKYKLTNPSTPSSSNLSTWSGKYTFFSTNSTITGSSIYYIVTGENGNVYAIQLKDGNDLNYYNDSYTYGSSYTDNGDGTYTIKSPTTISRRYYYNYYSNMSNQYLCVNATNNKCSNLLYIHSASAGSMSTIRVYEKLKYASGFSYDNNTETYILNEDSVSFWNYFIPENINKINTHHYTCLNDTGVCNQLAYVYYVNNSYSYLPLTGGKSIEDAVNGMLYDDNVNTYNSKIKEYIDNWYSTNIYDYSYFIEDTIYCNNRKQSNNNGWNSNGNVGEKLIINKDDKLLCDTQTDMFSINNDKAKLTYPIGLLTRSEMSLLGNGKIRKTGENYFILDYGVFDNRNAFISAVNTNGEVSGSYNVISNNGVRPAISLKENTKIKDGDGSKNNPYKVSYVYPVNIEVNNDTQNVNIDINNITNAEVGEEVKFTVTPKKGYTVTKISIVDQNGNELSYNNTGNDNEYVFTMPNSGITIIPSYERVKNAVNVEDNKNTKELIIEVNDSQAVVYEDTVRFRVEPEEGYEVDTIDITDEEQNKIDYRKTKNINEYEFTMPDTAVTIKPQYRKIESSTLINPNTNRQILFIIISIIMFVIITTIYTRKKKRLNTN